MRALADTSLFIGLEANRTPRSTPPDDLVTSVITIAELRLGVLTAGNLDKRQRRLSTLQFASLTEPLAIDDRVAEAWAGLIAALRLADRRMPVNDSWIAATALAHQLPVVTFDRDFENVPGLGVIAL